jgi:ribosomal protein S12 methylthiotransferase
VTESTSSGTISGTDVLDVHVTPAVIAPETKPGAQPAASVATARPKVGFVSLGCPKNLVDSEVMMGLLHHHGAELTQRAEDAEILVVNTCSFIDSAKQESVNTILEMARHKIAAGGRARRLIVAGCLVERYRDEIRKNIPEVDAVVGTGELEHILAAAGLEPMQQPITANSPFYILPQGSALPTTATAPLDAADLGQPSIDARLQRDLEVFPAGTALPIGETLVERARSSVSQHSRPLSDSDSKSNIAPQLRIAQSLAETGTTHGDEPLTHNGPHVGHVSHGDKPAGATPNHFNTPASDHAGATSSTVASTTTSPTTSRPEGDARESAGRFSREAWDGATAALPDYLYSDATPRILATPRASAYIKIAEGCDHPCSFCIIPQLRGKFRSRRIGSILAEAQNLIAQGVREITLIGQDTTCFGEDLGLKDGLAQLLDALAPLPGLRWLRFLYTYPNKVTTRLLETMARHDNVAKYLDVPLQHASAPVLKTMKRGGNAAIFLDLIAKARRIVPGIVIRTSFIVGFPGETEQDFDVLCNFVKAAEIDWLGVFTYSDEEGAKAFDLPDASKLPQRTIQARRRKLMKLQQRVSTKAKRQWVGRTVDVLVEGESEETELLWEGRTMLHAPEIDGKVLINDFGPHESLVRGTFYRAEITESHDYDVVARIVE